MRSEETDSIVPDGLGIPSASLEQLQKIELVGKQVISVENLTTFHGVSETEGIAVLYLGGFHNTVRTRLLTRLYQEFPDAAFYRFFIQKTVGIGMGAEISVNICDNYKADSPRSHTHQP